MFADTPKAAPFDPALLSGFEAAAGAVNGVRGIRVQKNIAPKEALTLLDKGGFPAGMRPLVCKLANLSAFETADTFEGAQGVSFLVGTTELFVPLTGLVNADEEIAKLEKELAYQEIFLEGVRKKLGNEKFTAHAPASVIEMEKKKEADALSRIESYKAQIAALKKQ